MFYKITQFFGGCMGLAARRERERFEVREKILDATRTLLATHGYDGVTMRKIAEAIEYSPTVIYSHFKDKQALIDALLELDYAALGAELRTLLDEPDALKRLRKLAGRFANFALEHPDHYRVIAMTTVPGVKYPRLVSEHVEDEPCDPYGLALHTISEAIDQGRLRAELDDAELVTQTFVSGIHGVVSMYITNVEDQLIRWRPIQRRISLMIDALLIGMAATDSEVAR